MRWFNPLAVVLFAMTASARPAKVVPPDASEIVTLTAERDMLIRGGLLEDRIKHRSLVSATELGIAGQNAFAVMNGGVDPVTHDCLCLRPGNYMLQGLGKLSKDPGKPTNDSNTVLRMARQAIEAPGGFGISMSDSFNGASEPRPAPSLARLEVADGGELSLVRNRRDTDGAPLPLALYSDEPVEAARSNRFRQGNSAFGSAGMAAGSAEPGFGQLTAGADGPVGSGAGLLGYQPPSQQSLALGLPVAPVEEAKVLIASSQPTLFQNTLRFYAATAKTVAAEPRGQAATAVWTPTVTAKSSAGAPVSKSYTAAGQTTGVWAFSGGGSGDSERKAWWLGVREAGMSGSGGSAEGEHQPSTPASRAASVRLAIAFDGKDLDSAVTALATGADLSITRQRETGSPAISFVAPQQAPAPVNEASVPEMETAVLTTAGLALLLLSKSAKRS